MAREIELKLTVPRTAIGRAIKLPWLRDLVDGPIKREMLTSVYFDTRKLKLRDHGLALRVRHIGKKRLQTIKAIRKGGRGALGRDEWEEEISESTPDLQRAKGTALAPLVTNRLRRRLRPVFRTVVERQTLPVRVAGSALEVAIDQGYVKAGGFREDINEIELELKGGSTDDIARVAEQLAGSLRVAYGARPKQDRGYALVAGAAAAPVHAAPIDLGPRVATVEAFQVIAFACLDHALSNERAVREGDPEGIHQMRVGLRRLRAALSLFKPLIDGRETDAIKAELKWLTGQLAPARDFDVLVRDGVQPLARDAPAPETDALINDLEARRDAGFERAKAAVEDERYRKLGVQTALWLINGKWTRRGDAPAAALRDRPAAEFGMEVLDDRLKAILRKARRIERLDPRRRHKLRIAVKKLRYATGFFMGLFEGDKKRARFAAQLKRLQGALGRLNDIEVHKGIARQVARRERAASHAGKALAVGFVLGHEQTETEPCAAAVVKSAKRLAHLAVFWESGGRRSG